MEIPTIKKLEELITPHIDKNKKIAEYKMSRLTAPGDNYGSLMLKVDLVLTDKEGANKEKLSVVAKLIPEEELFQKIFNIQVTCKNEIAFYDVIVPTLQNFQREQGVKVVADIFPRAYGARINLKENSEIVDEDSVLVLENVIINGYKNENRQVGCDLETTKVILRDLAQFHAIPLALKILQPEVFDKKVRAYMAYLHPQNAPEEMTEPANIVYDVLRDCKECIPLIPVVKESLEFREFISKTFREPFATLAHGDMWVNNFMVKREHNRPVHTKFVDFQMFSYDSPARDLLFFLNTSVQLNALKEHLDDLLKLYHDTFVTTLRDLKCSTENFTFDKFIEEIEATVPDALGHSLLFLLIIVTAKKGLKNSEDPSQGPSFGTKDDTQPEAREKAWWIVQEYHRRKWINP